MKHCSRLRSVDNYGWFRLRALGLLGDAAILSFIQDIGLRFLGLPRGGQRHPQRRFARRFERFHANLDEDFQLCAVAGTVGADGLLPHFGKEKRTVSGPFGARGATARGRQQVFILSVKRCVRYIEKNFSRNPLPERPDRDRFRFLVLQDGGGCSMLRETLGKRTPLVVGLLCSRLHNNRYVASVKMRYWTSNLPFLKRFPPLSPT